MGYSTSQYQGIGCTEILKMSDQANYEPAPLPRAAGPAGSGISMPVLCPKCDGFVGRTDGSGIQAENGAEADAQPDLTVIIACPCGHKWSWPK